MCFCSSHSCSLPSMSCPRTCEEEADEEEDEDRWNEDNGEDEVKVRICLHTSYAMSR